MGTKLMFSTTCHPQTDGQTKVVNRTLSQLLRTLVRSNLKNWEDCLPFTEFAYNRVVHSSTAHTPFEIVYGINPLSPLDLVPLPINDRSSLEGAKKAELMKKIHARIKQNIEQRNEQRARKANTGRKQVIFQPGEWVWVHMRKERFPTQRKSKLQPRGDGPFRVVERINDNAYKLALPGEYNVSATFNVSDLSPFHDADGDLRTNPLEEREDDAGRINSASGPVPNGDPWRIPEGPITRAEANEAQARLNGVIQGLMEGCARDTDLTDLKAPRNGGGLVHLLKGGFGAAGEPILALTLEAEGG